MRLFIESSRKGYKPEQCGKTLTVRELIEQLQQFDDEDAKVYISNDGGYTFGSLNQWSITEDWDDEEEAGPVE
jgi:hypothetical protein